MKEEFEQLKKDLERADQQRFMALKNALETVDLFASPSLKPDPYLQFDEIRKQLLELYQPKTTDWLKIIYPNLEEKS